MSHSSMKTSTIILSFLFYLLFAFTLGYPNLMPSLTITKVRSYKRKHLFRNQTPHHECKTHIHKPLISFWCDTMEASSSLWNWKWDYQEEVRLTEEQKHAPFYSILELETRVAYAREENARKRDEVLHLKCLLAKAIKETDESQFMCQRLVLENLILQQKVQKFEASASFARVPASYIKDDPIVGVASASSSESTEFFAKTKKFDKMSLPLLPSSSLTPHAIDNMVLTKRLPKNGKFLQAMKEAGPLLQTILLAGPIPQWRNPPPQLNSIDISLAFATNPQNVPPSKFISLYNHHQ
ncbi:hypothetical protein L6452_14169 [Arctium lappa]|uniref:Uncharacterized protein n=1 Tax=Arctium lappa TaxID=4217 RepID=A0ACB9CK70_ARCLA|nr:hypothetical protein L6452_14169 [Arctium lappa]